MKITAIAFIIAIVCSNYLSAQVMIPKGKELGRRTVSLPKDTLQELAAMFEEAKWNELQCKVKQLFDELCPVTKCDSSENYYYIVFAAKSRKGKMEIFRFLYNDHIPKTETFTARLPGLQKIYELTIEEKGRFQLSSIYISTQKKDPVLDQVPLFVKQFYPFVLQELLSEGAMLFEEVKEEVVLETKLYQINLPHKRAALQIKDSLIALSVPPQDQSETVTKNLLSHELAMNVCGQTLAMELNIKIQSSTGDREELKKLVKSTYTKFIKDKTCKGMTEGDLQRLILVESTYLKALDPPVTLVAEAEWKNTNIPFRRYSFGLVSSYIVQSWRAEDRAKISDEGTFVEDPLRGSMNMGVVNIHLKRYDTEAVAMTRAERFRFFVGGVLNPEFGVAGGIGFGIVRGLSVNFGGALLFISNPAAGKTFGDPVSSSGDVFDTGYATTLFLGAGYSF